MQVVIPMAGLGTRFSKKGYHRDMERMEEKNKRYETLNLIWESIRFYERALSERIRKNNSEGVDLGQTRVLYSRLIEELKLYMRTLEVTLNQQDEEFFSDFFKDGKEVEGTVAFLEATWGEGTANKARKWLSQGMVKHFERSYKAVNDYY